VKKNILFIISILFLATALPCLAHLPRIVYGKVGDIVIYNPENSQAFYDNLSGEPRNYIINSDKEFKLYINLLVPAINGNSRYSANIFQIKENGIEEKVDFIDGQSNFVWQEYYEEFGRDYYYKGPEFEKNLSAGNYKIQVFNYSNKGKYVIAVGKNEVFSILETAQVYWILPKLKMQFFQTDVLEFLFTPFGIIGIGIIGVIIIIIAFINFIASIIKAIKNQKPKLMLLTSSGIVDSKQEIMAILPKPAENIRIAHIITASNQELDKAYVELDGRLMCESGFNVEKIDIENKNYSQVLNLLMNFDIIYVQGGNTFYLLSMMRKCNFKKIIKKLLKKGIIYIGVSAGSIVAGKNIETAKWLGDENIVHMSDMNFMGLNLLPYNIVVHYNEGIGKIIKSKIPNPKKRKKIKLLQDGQAIFVLGNKISFVGTGQIINPINL